MKTPITIITGYLGSGKTTLLKHILKETKDKLAIIMNEFGEIAIDSKIIKGKNVNMKELAGGCVCCSLTGEFEAAINEIIQKIKPDSIIVETTGVAEPDAIIVDIEENISNVSLDGIVTIVDADAMIRYPTLGHTGVMQIEMADIILLNKTDLINNKQIKEIESKIKKINDKALIFKTENCKIDIGYLFGVNTKKIIKKHNHHEIKVGHFVYSSNKIFGRNKFEDFISKLPKEVYRAKGFVKFKDSSYLFNYVAGRYGFEKFKHNKNELVFIGEGINKIKYKILKEIEKL
ncbi:GTP-binding protein [Candidatus Woesearchaeota archaeon]|nr:GTP-binding protein [Candidatus Woesearchaeota archaeon]